MKLSIKAKKKLTHVYTNTSIPFTETGGLHPYVLTVHLPLGGPWVHLPLGARGESAVSIDLYIGLLYIILHIRYYIGLWLSLNQVAQSSLQQALYHLILRLFGSGHKVHTASAAFKSAMK